MARLRAILRSRGPALSDPEEQCDEGESNGNLLLPMQDLTRVSFGQNHGRGVLQGLKPHLSCRLSGTAEKAVP